MLALRVEILKRGLNKVVVLEHIARESGGRTSGSLQARYVDRLLNDEEDFIGNTDHGIVLSRRLGIIMVMLFGDYNHACSQ